MTVDYGVSVKLLEIVAEIDEKRTVACGLALEAEIEILFVIIRLNNIVAGLVDSADIKLACKIGVDFARMVSLLPSIIVVLVLSSSVTVVSFPV